MKNVSLKKFADNFTGAPAETGKLRTVVLSAMSAVENAKQLCMLAGQMLLDEKEKMEHGEFQAYIAKSIPEISYETAKVWMRAATNILKALPPLTVDVEAVTVSEVLAKEDSELSPDQRKYKQAWLDFTADKTIKECLNSVTVYGDDAHRVDRAVNGKTKGGKGSAAAADRKAFEKFIALKLAHITTFLTVQKSVAGRRRVMGWRQLPPAQDAAVKAAFSQFWKTAPRDVLELSMDVINQELKLNDAERLAR